MDAEAPTSYDAAHRSLRVRPIRKKWGLVDRSNSEHNLEENFMNGGHKRHGTMGLRHIGVSLRDYLFDDVKSCSTELAILDEVLLLLFIIS